jgi:3-deoxy-D-manno-octulosonic-acid transferase
MALPQALYRTALRALRALSPVLMRGESKLARGLRGRRDAHERLVAWGGGVRSDQPVIWVHASSVGESLQARAVIDVLRRRKPGLRVVFTFFSPSAERVCEDFPADICSYLPWDLPGVMGSVLDTVQPSVIMFTQREVWPTLADQAATRGVPTVLIAGTMPEGAGRLSLAGRLLLSPAFRSLRAVGAVSKEDGERFGLLGVKGDRVTVTGDSGVDAVRDRVAGIDRTATHMRIFGDERGPILVAGSTWPSDEEVLIPAVARVRESVPGWRIVLAPHEPDGCDFAGLGRALAADGWTPALLGDIEGAPGAEGAHGADVILVDRVGVLADLYALGSIAYVGGGFHTGGLHSVLEPAAAALPVLIGPRWKGSVHTAPLVAAGAARSVADAEALAHALGEWAEDPEKNEDAGQRAIAYIESHRGSAECTADLISQFLPRQDRLGTLSEGET